MAGALVVFEGIDQAGKMTQARAVRDHVQRQGLSCEVRQYPEYSTPVGQLLEASLNRGVRLDARVRALLFAANRWEKDPEIRSLRDANTLVLVDRYTASNVAYGLAQGLDPEWLRNLESGLLQPDLTLFLGISVAESSRRKARGRDDFESNAPLLEAARTHYQRLATEEGWVLLNGEAPQAEVTARLLAALDERLGPKLGQLSG